MPGPDITISYAPPNAHSSDRSASLTDGEDSSGTGVQVSLPSAGESQDFSDKEYTDSLEDYEDENDEIDESWTSVNRDEVAPSDSASRPRHSNPPPEAPRPEIVRRQSSRREDSHTRAPHSRPRQARHLPPPASESVDYSHEEWQGDLPLHPGRPYVQWPPASGGPNPRYTTGYPNQAYSPFPNSAMPPGQQLVPLSGNTNPQYGFSSYQQPGGGSGQAYYPHGHHGPSMSHHMSSHGSPPYGGPEVMQHPPLAPTYFQYPQGYPIPHGLAPSPVYAYPQVYPPPPAPVAAPVVPTPPPPAPTQPPADTSKDDEKFEEIKKLFLEQKAEHLAREAAAKKAEEDRAAKAAADKKIQEDIEAAAKAAAATATTEAEKKAAIAAAKAKAEVEAEKKAAEEAAAKKKAEADAAAKAKADTDAAAAKAKADADAAAAAAAKAAAKPPPPPEKKKPIKFKDAVGRKFSFPFHLCNTWHGMEDLIRQAFLHVDIIGPHVAEGHYDLVGPNGEIILPQVWETMVEPEWTITMHMWPMPEPKAEEPVVNVPPPPPPPVKDGKKPGKSSASVPPPPPPPPSHPGAAPTIPTGPKKPTKKNTGPFNLFGGGSSKPKPKTPKISVVKK